MVAVMAFMAMGLVSMPAHAIGITSTGTLDASLEDNGVVNCTGNVTINGTGFSAYLRAYQEGGIDLLLEQYLGDLTPDVQMDFTSALSTLALPIPADLTVELWALDLNVVRNMEQRRGSNFWRFVNNWFIPGHQPAYAIMLGPDLPANAYSVLVNSVTINTQVISLDADEVAFTNTTDPQTITITNYGNSGLSISNVGDDNPLEPPFSLTEDCTTAGVMASGETCGITVTFDPSSLAGADVDRPASGSIYAKAGLGSGIILLGLAFSAGSIRRRRIAIGLIIVLALSMGLLMACGSSDSGIPYYLNLEDKTTYSDTFEVTSDDPDNPTREITVSATVSE